MIDFDAALRGRREVVIDASLVGDALIGEATRKTAARDFLRSCRHHGVRLLVPPTFTAETDTLLRQNVLRGKLPAGELPATYAALDALVVEVELDENVLQIVRRRAREIAAQLDQPSVYDATYAALAELRGCDFWTADKRFANAAHQNRRAPDGTTSPAFPLVRSVRD